MSVLASLDIAKGSWNFVCNPESLRPTIEIGFCEGDGPVKMFDNLSFGFDVFVDDEKECGFSYPPSGITYIATDQTYLVFEQIAVASDDEVVLKVWAENGGIRFEGETSFEIPRPEKPFPSWSWDGVFWQPPTPYPSDGKRYRWDEESGSWVERESE